MSASLLLYVVFLRLLENNKLVDFAYFLALPVLGLAACRLSPAWAWSLTGSWCLLTTILTLYGHGPCLLRGANMTVDVPELMIYLALIAVFIHFWSRAASQVRLRTQKAKLRNLQANLNPHFIFNSLNVIRALVYIDPKKADEAIGSLAGLMRSRLTNSDADLIDLSEELGHIRELLHLARLRFGKRMSSRVRVDRDLLKTPVPPMMLLNLVENAITHGISNLEQGGMIHITGKAVGEKVRLSIRSSGTLALDYNDGIGTREARQRLKLLFGQRASFAISQLDAENVIVEIHLPQQHLPEDALIS